MKRVNLLPNWYVQQRRQNRNLRVHLGIMTVLGVAMLGGLLLAREEVTGLNRMRGDLDAMRRDMGDPGEEVQSLRAELGRLNNLEVAYHELGNTIPMSKVVQQVQNDMTPGMSLLHVVIDVRPEPVNGTGMVGDTKNPPRYHDVLHLDAVGVGQNDQEISRDFYARLQRNPLFTHVTLDYMRGALLKDYVVRQFETQLDMDLDRLTTEDPEAVAAAAPGAGKGAGDAH